MSPEMALPADNPTILYVLDAGILVLGVGTLIYLRRIALGERLGKVLTLIGLGIVAIALNHFADTAYVRSHFGDVSLLGTPASHLIHHLGNLFGFILIFLGYFRASRSLVGRSVVYALLLGWLGAAYLAGYVFITRNFFHLETLHNDHEIWLGLLTLGLILAVQPLKRLLVRLTDRLFFQYTYNTESLLAALSRAGASTFQLDRLMDLILKALSDHMRLTKAEFVVIDEGKVYATRAYGAAARPEADLARFDQLPMQSKPLVVNQLEDSAVRQTMERIGVAAVAPLVAGHELAGFLLLGGKKSEEILTEQDVRVINIAVPEIAVAVANAKAVDKIERFNATLQQEVQRATADLQAANRNLKALDKTKDEFLSMASHQLRTPLTTIKGYLSMMAEGDVGAVNAQQKEFLDYALGGAERMVGLIADLLNVSRMSAGRFLIEKRPVDLVEIVADEVQQLSTHAAAKQLKLVFQPPDRPLPPVELDEGKTRQVIMNFIDNAIYYTRQGSVTVRVEAGPGVERLLVTDTGIGVPLAAHKNLFTKFFRADNAQAARPDGTGLGLYMAKRVVEDQGGRIIFDSTEGQGSTFGFEMPLGPAQPKNQSPEPTRPEAAASKAVELKA
ncbi:HAMP domain-containing histidine kinase [Candidatus Parcubacteria bacterium]|nr:HAMP domain-containing histidine kinase [Candidatus Parcubacteria bacterium]